MIDKAMIYWKVKEMFPDFEMEVEDTTEVGSWLVEHVMNEMTDMLSSASLEEKIEAVKIILS